MLALPDPGVDPEAEPETPQRMKNQAFDPVQKPEVQRVAVDQRETVGRRGGTRR